MTEHDRPGRSPMDEVLAGMERITQRHRRRAQTLADRHHEQMIANAATHTERAAALSTGRVAAPVASRTPWWHLTAVPPDVAGMWSILAAVVVAVSALVALPWPDGVVRGLAVAGVLLALGFGLLALAGVRLPGRAAPITPLERRRR